MTYFFVFCLQGDHGKFELTLTQDGEPFDVFTVVPNQVLNRATLLIQVQNTSALDYEVVKSYTFEVRLTALMD